MTPLDQRTKRFIRNLKATRIISALLAVEQLLYGLFLIQPGAPVRTQYFLSALLISFLCLISLLISKPNETFSGLGYPFFEMLPLALGMFIALNRMFANNGILLNIPTLYLAFIYGGAVFFLLDYVQSGILYGTFTIASIVMVNSHALLAKNVPFRTDFVINNGIAWTVSALNYRYFRQEQKHISLIEEQNQQLRMLSEQDTLTGLLNRRKIDSIISELLQNNQGGSAVSAVILFDLDHFKLFNDTFVHQRGDLLLKEIPALARDQLLENESLARWGGEEFLILSKRDGKALAESLRENIENHVFEQVGKITASFGVSPVLPDDSEVKIFRQVDKALYHAKEMGRNRVELFRSS